LGNEKPTTDNGKLVEELVARLSVVGYQFFIGWQWEFRYHAGEGSGG
jgi:hypothetical protein